ncbi:cation:proton antiporter [Halobaculum lipolyticum]|uniref:Cation:proton antiporter n=1 Tax=Halobaculum lipolyticum TaxID=3032001 RepID=A0ABD5W6T7_9EURY|nr:cation:proton antiporter [Halobaculum sp. DT31]
MVTPSTLLTAGAAFVALAVAGGIARRVGQSVIAAYILVGILVGPAAPTVGGTPLTLLASAESLRLLADLGVVLLLFFVGLELSLDHLFAERNRFFLAGVADVGISLPLGVGVGLALGFSWLEAGFVGLIVFNSSTVIVAKSLTDLGWVADAESHVVLGVLVIEDVLTALGFAVLSVFLVGGADVSDAAASVARSLVFLVVLVAAAYYGAGLLERAFDGDSGELFSLGVIGVGAAVAGVGLAVGVSEAVAAFVVGTAFGRTHHAARIERLLAPIRDLFAAVFFLAIGVATDPRLLTATFAVVAAATVVTVAGQLFSGSLAGLAYGLDRRRAIRVGCALAPRGEFSLVIAAFLATAGTTPALRETIPAFTVGYVLVTSVLGTVLMRNADRISAALPARRSVAGSDDG